MQPAGEFDCDILVVGGGINGVGIARDAAGRGLSVVLCEKDDLASHTSSASSKLIHGGLRYLEYYDFNLVHKALAEREILMRSAPHCISPLRFVMPHMEGLRPKWLLRCGLFLYDHLARRHMLPASESIDLRKHVAGLALHASFKQGFAYSDAWVDDARLVVLAARDAAEKGATILTRTRCESAVRQDGQWHATLRDGGQRDITINARCLINATGAWAAQFQHAVLPAESGAKHLRLVKGSHIVVSRLFEHAYAYLFQHTDGRIVFALPYENEFTLIGTTDIDFQGDPNKVAIAPEEIAYLCELSNHYFQKALTPADVLWSFSGVRPLVDDGHADAKEITRDYQFELNQEDAPLLTVFGGKITTFRKLSEQAIDLIAPLLQNNRGAWTARACLPGGDLAGARPQNCSAHSFEQFLAALQSQYAWMPPLLLKRYASAYGTRVHVVLHRCQALQDLGELLAPDLYAAEVRYLMAYEWAQTAEDVLWRRTKLGLHCLASPSLKLEQWMAAEI